MKRNRLFAIVVLVLVWVSISTVSVFASSDTSIGIELDKSEAKVGDIIKASILVKNAPNFAGFQVTIRYNAEVLQAVNPDNGEAYNKSTVPAIGDLLANTKYSLVPISANEPEVGVLNFGRTYMDLNGYKDSKAPESAGTLAIIGFKVIKDAATEVVFQELGTTKGSVNGTMLFDWDGKQMDGYKVNNSVKINPKSSDAPMPVYTMKGTTVNNSSNNTTEGTSNSKTIIVIIVIVIVVIILISVFLLFGKGKTSQSDQWLDDEEDSEAYDETSEDNNDKD